MSRDPADLCPSVAEALYQHMRMARAAGLNPVLCRTYSSAREQDALFDRGRDEQGRVIDKRLVVTNVRGGKSWHNVARDGAPWSCAYDLLLVGPSKRALPDGDPAWIVLCEIGESLGMTCGARWGDNPETPQLEGWDKGHFQADGRGTLTLDDVMRGADPHPLEDAG